MCQLARTEACPGLCITNKRSYIFQEHSKDMCTAQTPKAKQMLSMQKKGYKRERKDDEGRPGEERSYLDTLLW